MITPRFSCSQTANSVVVSIYCPSIRAAELEIHVDETLLTVHVNPYYLRLNFSHNLLEDDMSSANYDPSSGCLKITLTKEMRGQEFEDLDLLAKLLAPRPTAHNPTIEVLSSDTIKSEEDDLVERTEGLSLEHDEILRAAKSDWQVLQEVPVQLSPLQTSACKRYGFLDMHSGYFEHVTYTENEVNELGTEAETCTVLERRQRRIRHENEKWDEEYYMADYADDENIQELLRWRSPYVLEERNFNFTEEEELAMLRLPRKEYLASGQQIHQLYLTLVTLLFAFAYDSRTTQNDPTPESAWTICSLTPAFSALDPPNLSLLSTNSSAADGKSFTTVELIDTLVPSYRRCLAFPLHRSFALAEACRKDIADFLIQGKRMVVRCLLRMKHILDHHEVYYVYSKIWVDDLCVWVQAYAGDDVLIRLGECLEAFAMRKGAIGWDLEDLEAAAEEVQESENDSDDESSDDFDEPSVL